MHDISQRSKLAHIQVAHKGKVSGLCFANQTHLLSCGVDRTVKLWGVGNEDSDAGPSVSDLKCLCHFLFFDPFVGTKTPEYISREVGIQVSDQNDHETS